MSKLTPTVSGTPSTCPTSVASSGASADSYFAGVDNGAASAELNGDWVDDSTEDLLRGFGSQFDER